MIVVDCAEGTHRQILELKNRIRLRNELIRGKRCSAGPLPGKVLPELRPTRLTRIFITHLHMDHCMGLPMLLNYLMSPSVNPKAKDPIQVYGPPGLRNFIRTILTTTSTSPWPSGQKYCVHELVNAEEPLTTFEAAGLHGSEAPGQDLASNNDGLWEDVLKTPRFQVAAGPIVHRARCLGYVFTQLENGAPAKKVVYLGDTSDPSRIAPLAQYPSLLIHEATLAHIPLSVDPKAQKTTSDSAKAKAIEKGHSTPSMAGAFAKSVGAKALLLNHFSARYPDVRFGIQGGVMHEIERLATKAWGQGKQARAAHDFLRVELLEDGSEDFISI